MSAEHLATGATPEALFDQYTRQLYLSIGETALAAAPPKGGIWEFFAVTNPQLHANMGQMGTAILLRYWPYALLGMGLNFIRLFFASDYLPAWSRPIELVYHVALYSLALAGGLSAYRRKCWQLLTLTVAPIVYIAFVNIISTTTNLRMASTMMVPIIVLAVVGLAHIRPVWIAGTWVQKGLELKSRLRGAIPDRVSVSDLPNSTNSPDLSATPGSRSTGGIRGNLPTRRRDNLPPTPLGK